MRSPSFFIILFLVIWSFSLSFATTGEKSDRLVSNSIWINDESFLGPKNWEEEQEQEVKTLCPQNTTNKTLCPKNTTIKTLCSKNTIIKTLCPQNIKRNSTSKYKNYNYSKEILDVVFPGYLANRKVFLDHVRRLPDRRRIPQGLLFTWLARITDQRLSFYFGEMFSMIKRRIELDRRFFTIKCLLWARKKILTSNDPDDIIALRVLDGDYDSDDATENYGNCLLSGKQFRKHSAILEFKDICISRLLCQRIISLGSKLNEARDWFSNSSELAVAQERLYNLDYDVFEEVLAKSELQVNEDSSHYFVEAFVLRLKRKTSQMIQSALTCIMQLELIKQFSRQYGSSSSVMRSHTIWLLDVSNCSPTLISLNDHGQIFNDRLTIASFLFTKNKGNLSSICQSALSIIHSQAGEDLFSLKDFDVPDCDDFVQKMIIDRHKDFLASLQRRYDSYWNDNLAATLESVFLHDSLASHLRSHYGIRVGPWKTIVSDCLSRHDSRSLELQYDQMLLTEVLLRRS